MSPTPKMTNLDRTLPALLLAGLLALDGCTLRKYQPAPIVPTANAVRLESRTLDDPGLREFLHKNNAETGASWDLNRLTLAAFYYSSELDAVRARLQEAQAAIMTAGARPNPSISAAPGVSGSPESPWLFIFDFDVPIETAGKRGFRVQQAQHLSESARLELAQVGWQIRGRIRAALLDHFLALQHSALLNTERTLRTQAMSPLVNPLASRRVPRPELDAAQIELATLNLAIRTIEGDAAQSRAAIAAVIGVPIAALDHIQFEWLNWQKPAPADGLSLDTIERAAVVNRVDLRRMLAEYAAAESALQLEIAKQRPDLVLGPGYDFDEGHHKFRLGVSLTLPIFDRNQGPIRAAEARRQEIAAQFLSIQSQIIGESAKALAGYKSAILELHDVDESLASLHAQRERMARASFDAGASDRLDLVGIQIQGAVAMRARQDALRRAQVSLGALEDALQHPIQPAIALPEIPERRGQP